jgi:hypothetical protein
MVVITMMWLWHVEVHDSCTQRNTQTHLMIINVECNVKMPEPHVIHAVPWNLKVTLSMISSGSSA